MPEVMSVIKSLVVTVIIVVCLQVKVGPMTAEDHMQSWMKNSSITGYLRDVAQGAGLVIHNAASVVSDFASAKFGGASSIHEKQEAGRLNFDFKRSLAYEKSKSNN